MDNQQNKKRAPMKKAKTIKLACDWLVFDISNIYFRSFYVQRESDADTITGMAMYNVFLTLNKYFKDYQPTKGVVVAFDRRSWRKEFTASESCISKRPYKGNRRQNMSITEQLKFEEFVSHINELEEFMRRHTTMYILAGERLEADDLIAGMCQTYIDDDIVVISADSDLAQLQSHNTVVVSPATNLPQSLEKYDDDPAYYLFQKCIRGDSTDNVASAYPRVRSTRIKQAYTDAYMQTNMFNETWMDVSGTEFKVGDLFKENQILIDLSKQPDDIRQIIESTILEEMTLTQKNFSMFHMLKFLGKNKLDKMKDNVNNFISLLSN